MKFPRANWITRIVGPVRGLGPYAAIELILPGGSLIALSLWAIRNRAWFATQVRGVLSRLPGGTAVAKPGQAMLIAERPKHTLDLVSRGASCTARS